MKAAGWTLGIGKWSSLSARSKLAGVVLCHEVNAGTVECRTDRPAQKGAVVAGVVQAKPPGSQAASQNSFMNSSAS